MPAWYMYEQLSIVLFPTRYSRPCILHPDSGHFHFGVGSFNVTVTADSRPGALWWIGAVFGCVSLVKAIRLTERRNTPGRLGWLTYADILLDEGRLWILQFLRCDLADYDRFWGGTLGH
jgi:hypothetical protein